MIPPGPTPAISQAASTALIITFHTLGSSTTLLRLAHRLAVQKLWWDDFWAFMAMLLSIIPFAVYFNLPHTLQSTSFSLISFSVLGTLVFYTAALWSAKLSVAVTIVRLSQKESRFRGIAFIATLLFVVAGVTMMLQKLFVCGTRFDVLPLCPIPIYTGYLELTLDLLGDMWLIASPLYMLYGMKLPREHTRLLCAIFACGLFATASNIVHIYYVIKYEPVLAVVTSHIQLNVNIITCNLLVLVTFLYRKLQDDQVSVVVRSETSEAESEAATDRGRFTDLPGVKTTDVYHPSTPWSTRTTHLSLSDMAISMRDSSLTSTFDKRPSNLDYELETNPGSKGFWPSRSHSPSHLSSGIIKSMP